MRVTIKAAIRLGWSFYTWKRHQPDVEKWSVGEARAFQLAFEREEYRASLVSCKDAGKEFIATDRNGWPEGGKSCKKFAIFQSREDAAKDGLRAFGKRNFIVVEFPTFRRTFAAKWLQRKMTLLTKIQNDRRIKR